MSIIFAENAPELIVGSQTATQSSQYNDGLKASSQVRKNASISKISHKMARKKINGSWKVSTRVIGSLVNEEEEFPFIETDMSAMSGNYDTLLNHMNRFNTWVKSSSRSNSSVRDSYPILVDLDLIRDSRSLYHTPIPGLVSHGEDISLRDLEYKMIGMFREIYTLKRSFHTAVNSSSRKNKEQNLLRLIESKSDYIDYFVQNAIPVEEKTGATILHLAAAYNLPELVKMITNLDSSGRLLDSRDNFGRTPLMRAAVNGSDTAAEILLNNGASVHYIDHQGNSALTYATMTSSASSKQVACVCVTVAGSCIFPPLAFAGAAGEVYVNGKRIISPDFLCDHVFSCGHKKIARMLEERGADQSLKAGWSQLNSVSNTLTTPWRIAHKGIRYVGKLDKVDDDRL